MGHWLLCNCPDGPSGGPLQHLHADLAREEGVHHSNCGVGFALHVSSKRDQRQRQTPGRGAQQLLKSLNMIPFPMVPWSIWMVSALMPAESELSRNLMVLQMWSCTAAATSSQQAERRHQHLHTACLPSRVSDKLVAPWSTPRQLGKSLQARAEPPSPHHLSAKL